MPGQDGAASVDRGPGDDLIAACSWVPSGPLSPFTSDQDD